MSKPTVRAIAFGTVLILALVVAHWVSQSRTLTPSDAARVSYPESGPGIQAAREDPMTARRLEMEARMRTARGGSERKTGAAQTGGPDVVGLSGGTTTSPDVTPGAASGRERYGEARELARQGRFDRAEGILEDVAASDTPWGRKAKEHLAFDFHYEKMQWLMVHRRFDECAETGRMLLKRNLAPAQTDRVEAILDRVGQFDDALSGAERAAALGACRHVTICLARSFAEDDRYPDRLSISDFGERGIYSDHSVLMGLSAIEDYRSTVRSYSFVAVSSKGRHRIQVVDGVIRQ